MEPSAPNDRHRRHLAALLLVLGTLLAYAGVLHNRFVAYDDDTYLTNNPHVREGLSADSLVWALTTGTASNWHPLTWVSHLLDVSLFGLNPAGHHAVSVVLHLLAGLVLFGVLLRASGALRASFLVAALFLWHPLRVESVAWAAERKDVLSGLLFALTLWAYARWTRQRGAARYVLALLLFALGLMAKPMLVSVPLVLLLFDAWPLDRWSEGRGARERVREKLPFVGLAAVSSLVTVLVQRAGGAVVEASEVSPLLRVGNALRALGVYAWQFLWPADLACFYPHPLVTGAPVWGPAALVGLAFALLLALAWRQRSRTPWLGVGLLWFVAMSLPVLGLVQVGRQAHADRYTYLPSIGLALVLAFGLDRLARGALRRPLELVAVAALGGLVVTTRAQVEVWRSSETLFRHALAVTEDNHLAEGNLGYVLLQEERYQEARTHLERALAILPGDATTRLNHAVVCLRLGDLDAARTDLDRLARQTPDDWRVHSNRGELALRSGAPERAAESYREALRLGSPTSQDRVNLGMAELQCGRIDEAREAFRSAGPENADGRYGLGVVALEERDFAQARGLFADVVASHADHADAWEGLASALEGLGRRAEALDARARARALAGDWTAAARLQASALSGLPAEQRAAAEARLASYRAGKAPDEH